MCIGSAFKWYKLINDILDFSKIEASRVDIEAVDFDIVELIEEICYIQCEPAERKSLSLNHIIDSGVPQILRGDPGKIRQVIMNLVGNAIKFTHDGWVNVRVNAKDSASADDQITIQIVVEDSGIGMDAKTAERVFEPFTQADASTTRKYGGTGLGLSISRRYIDLLGGQIEVKSESGVGTSILVEIPLFNSSEAAIAKSGFGDTIKVVIVSRMEPFVEMLQAQLSRAGISNVEANPEDVPARIGQPHCIWFVDFESIEADDDLVRQLAKVPRGIAVTPLRNYTLGEAFKAWPSITKPTATSVVYEALRKILYKARPINAQTSATSTEARHAQRVLIAEDIPTNQRIAQEMVEMLGYRAEIANDGSEAVRMQERTGYDLIFMDCQMPIMDGYTAARQIRVNEENLGRKAVPIIALTAGITRDEKSLCFESGMTDYLGKPFKLNDLKDVLAKHLGQSLQTGEPVNFSVNGPDFEASNQDPTPDLIDYQAVNNILEIEKATGRAILLQVFSGFMKQMDEKLLEIDTALSQIRIEDTYKCAHAIKSMSANIGAEQVKSIAGRLEAQARENSIEDPESYPGELRIALSTFCEHFRQEFSSYLEPEAESGRC